jgi:branched-chain amino acid transport system substrate-binding protein
MKKIIFVIMALLFLGACSQVEQPAEKVKVGVILPLTGAQGNYGEGITKGVELALKEINNLEIIYEDEQSETKAAVTAYNKLTDVDGVKIIVGPVLSGSMLGIAPLAEQKKTIILGPTAVANKISDAGDYTFRIRETATGHGKTMAEYAIAKGWKKGAMLNANAEGTLAYASPFATRYLELGGTLLVQELYDKDSGDARTQLSKIVAAKPDVIYTSGFAKDVGLNMKIARELGYTGPLLTTPAMEDKAFLTAAQGAGDGAIYTSGFNPGTPQAREFMQKYASTYNDPNFSWFVANAYDALKLMSKIAEKCNEDTNCIKQQLYSTQNYQGASGTFSFDANGDVERPMTLMQVKNGSFVPLLVK